MQQLAAAHPRAMNLQPTIKFVNEPGEQKLRMEKTWFSSLSPPDLQLKVHALVHGSVWLVI